MATHHDLDPYPIPKDKGALFVNEPWIADKSFLCVEQPYTKEPQDEPDNVRVYVPLDLNRHAILRRLNVIIAQYGEITWKNELDYCTDVEMIRYQLEIYDQVHHAQGLPGNAKHSEEGVALAREFVERLEEIVDGCAEVFPYEMIEELRAEYLEKA